MNVEGLVMVKQVDATPDDYIEAGILFCGRCRTPKEYEVCLLGKVRKVACLCDCMDQENQQEAEEREQRQRIEQIRRLRISCIQDKDMQNWRFAEDDGKNTKQMVKIRRYAEKWEHMYTENCGLLLWGGVGTGKTFAAACIANQLIDRGIPVLMTSFTSIVSAMGFDDNAGYTKELSNYRLLVIDDLGAERQSDYMLEKVYSIIDSRYRSGKPLIITTNLSLAEIKNTQNIQYKRIYDRILEMCIPMQFVGESRRVKVHEEKKDRLRSLLLEEED